ncbi:hypothetical protein, partial [Arthrobacter ginsengisoli]|uniref:hypothetical protein n=1 Tax=Arthrobacter ginsengisoli TaxID=1356565 RepID=UPI00286D3581
SVTPSPARRSARRIALVSGTNVSTSGMGYLQWMRWCLFKINAHYQDSVGDVARKRFWRWALSIRLLRLSAKSGL